MRFTTTTDFFTIYLKWTSLHVEQHYIKLLAITATTENIVDSSREACCGRLHDNITAISKNLIDTLRQHTDGSERLVQAVEAMAKSHDRMTSGKYRSLLYHYACEINISTGGFSFSFFFNLKDTFILHGIRM